MEKKFMVGGIKMELPLILGAGVAKHPSQVVPYLDCYAQLGAAVSGSYTMDLRDGNRGILSWPASFHDLQEQSFGLNSFGMPNIGIREAMNIFPRIPDKPHIISIAGFKTSDYLDALKLLNGHNHIAGVEINAGCPNTGHLPVAYSATDLHDLLRGILYANFHMPVWLKLSPYMTTSELKDFAEMHPHLDFSSTPSIEDEHYDHFLRHLSLTLECFKDVILAIVLTNTLPNVIYNTEIVVKNVDGSLHHKGGLSGPILRDHNLKLIKHFIASNINHGIDIIGCGGVLTGDDALAYLQAGCKGVQCTSGPYWHGSPRFFSDLIEGSEALQNHLFSENS